MHVSIMALYKFRIIIIIINIAGAVVPFHDTVKLLGVTLDSSLTMDRHVAGVLHSCNYHMRELRHIRPLLTHDTACRQDDRP